MRGMASNAVAAKDITRTAISMDLRRLMHTHKNNPAQMATKMNKTVNATCSEVIIRRWLQDEVTVGWVCVVTGGIQRWLGWCGYSGMGRWGYRGDWVMWLSFMWWGMWLQCDGWFNLVVGGGICDMYDVWESVVCVDRMWYLLLNERRDFLVAIFLLSPPLTTQTNHRFPPTKRYMSIS